MPANGIAITGTNQMAVRLSTITNRLATAQKMALFTEASIEMVEAKRRTPVDTGALRSSGMVHAPTVTVLNTSVRLTFGGPAVQYAWHVHEDVHAFHRVGQAKYLESVLNESRPFMGARLGRRIAKVMR